MRLALRRGFRSFQGVSMGFVERDLKEVSGGFQAVSSKSGGILKTFWEVSRSVPGAFQGLSGCSWGVSDSFGAFKERLQDRCRTFWKCYRDKLGHSGDFSKWQNNANGRWSQQGGEVCIDKGGWSAPLTLEIWRLPKAVRKLHECCPSVRLSRLLPFPENEPCYGQLSVQCFGLRTQQYPGTSEPPNGR